MPYHTMYSIHGNTHFKFSPSHRATYLSLILSCLQITRSTSSAGAPASYCPTRLTYSAFQPTRQKYGVRMYNGDIHVAKCLTRVYTVWLHSHKSPRAMTARTIIDSEPFTALGNSHERVSEGNVLRKTIIEQRIHDCFCALRRTSL